MDVYRQAAQVVEKVHNGQGTAKAMCLQKEMQKKKQTYAVACETLRRYDGLTRILELSAFFQYFPLVDKHMAMVLAYDALFGPGVKTRQHPAAYAIVNSLPFLQTALQQVAKEDPSIMNKYTRHIEEFDEKGEQNGDEASSSTLAARLPTYIRANTLIPEVDSDSVLRYFKKREQGDAAESEHFVPTVKRDPHVPHLLVLPPRSDLHKAKLFRNGSIVIQDKASCLPPCVLLGRVPVVPPEGSFFATNTTLRKLVDCCAAPGNKTSQLAAMSVEALGADSVKIVACEMDAKRAITLRDRLTFLKADQIVTVVEGDFMELDNKVRSRAEGVLLDPSCSASGMIKRIDVSAPAAAAEVDANAVEGGEESATDRRVEKLARMQEAMLVNVLTCYPRARRVVYSTCSVHERENEEVVRRALAAEGVASYWALANIMPDTWTSRGLPTTGEEGAAVPPTEFCIRCDPKQDHTNGFFVACFDRIAPAPPMS